MKELSIKAAQQKVDDWINTQGVRYFNELTNMAILTEEVGEVARIISPCRKILCNQTSILVRFNTILQNNE